LDETSQLGSDNADADDDNEGHVTYTSVVSSPQGATTKQRLSMAAIQVNNSLGQLKLDLRKQVVSVASECTSDDEDVVYAEVDKKTSTAASATTTTTTTPRAREQAVHFTLSTDQTPEAAQPPPSGRVARNEAYTSVDAPVARVPVSGHGRRTLPKRPDGSTSQNSRF
jgi:hypothetical protein